MAYNGTMRGDALICLVCGALVDNALVDEHDRFHTHSEHDRATATGQRGHGGQHPTGDESTERDIHDHYPPPPPPHGSEN